MRCFLTGPRLRDQPQSKGRSLLGIGGDTPLCDRERGFKSLPAFLGLLYKLAFLLTHTHTLVRAHIHAGSGARLSIQDKYIIPPPTHTYTPLNPVDYSLGNYSRDFCCLSFCLALSSPPLLSLPSLVNSPTWPGLPIPSFDEAVSAIFFCCCCFGLAQTDL